MKLSLQEDINSVSFFKANFNHILEKMEKDHHPMILTQNGKSAGVFLDMKTWEAMLKKIQFLTLLNEGERSLQNEKSITLDDIEESFKNKYDF